MTEREYQDLFALRRERVNEALRGMLDRSDADAGIREAMEYSLLAGGKRIRPVLCLTAAAMAGGREEDALACALAMECIHTYSLIHDDLPCMDDDDLRRGRPTSHVKYGEAKALLAGDALLNYAFELVLSAPAPSAERRLAAAGEIARCAGISGMIGGQVDDVCNDCTTEEELTRMCLGKTAALIRGALRAGCREAGGSEELCRALTEYADCLGLAFQMVDDVLDVVGDPEKLGKNVGSDEKDNKITFASLLGVEGCMERARQLTDRAKAALAPFAGSEFLCYLAEEMISRDH